MHMAKGFNPTEKKAFAPGGSLSTHKKREDVPADHFLMPAERKFPYKVNGKISCDLLRAAISRAGQTGRKDIEAKAKSLFQSNCAA